MVEIYKIKREKVDELLGISNKTKLADKLGITSNYLYGVCTNRINCKKPIVLSLISLIKGIPVNDYKIEEYIDYYFTREE